MYIGGDITADKGFLEAAEDLLGDPQRFSLNVRTSLGGGVVNGVKYDSVACSVHAQENRPQHR